MPPLHVIWMRISVTLDACHEAWSVMMIILMTWRVGNIWSQSAAPIVGIDIGIFFLVKVKLFRLFHQGKTDNHLESLRRNFSGPKPQLWSGRLFISCDALQVNLNGELYYKYHSFFHLIFSNSNKWRLKTNFGAIKLCTGLVNPLLGPGQDPTLSQPVNLRTMYEP